MKTTVPLRFQDPAYAAGVPLVSAALPYHLRPSDWIQRRFKSKLVAEPLVDLASYEFDSNFNWIQVYLETAAHFAPSDLQRHLVAQNEIFGGFHSCCVQCPPAEEFSLGHAFSVRFCAPRPAGLRYLLSTILRQYSWAGLSLYDVPLTGFEVSVDIFPRRRARTDMDCLLDRMIMSELIRKHISVSESLREGSNRPRFITTSGGESAAQHLVEPLNAMEVWATNEARRSHTTPLDMGVRDPASHHHPYIDSTFCLGHRHERLFYRCTDKTDEHSPEGGTYVLPSASRRSRIELSLTDQVLGDRAGPASIGIKNLFDLEDHGIRSLNSLLLFDLPVFARDESSCAGPETNEWTIFSRSGVAGLSHKVDVDADFSGDRRAKRALQRRKGASSGSMPRYQELNYKVRRAFERLEKRWRKEWRKADPECGGPLRV